MRYCKGFLLAFLLAILIAPALQAKFQWVKENTLVGAFNIGPRATFTWEGLRANTFQPALERYLEDRIGFRHSLIRLRNQLSFSLFRAIRSSDIVVGQREVLFQPGTIDAYAGRDLLDEKEVRFRVRRLRAVQRELGRRGVQLLFVMAPNKARFQPEDIPTRLRPTPGALTNYDLFTRAMHDDTVALLDLVPVFARWKHTKPYLLFPRAGTHWSGYGATLAADTLLRRLEAMGHCQFPTVRTVGPPRIVRDVDSLRATDNDLGWTLNLIWGRATPPLAYRRLAFDPPGPGQSRPSALFVGDSFTWGLMLFNPYMQREFSDDTRFWYYTNAVHLPDSVYHDTGEKVEKLDIRKQIEARRFIVLLFTEHNLTGNEYSFTKQVYQLYHPLTAADNARIQQLELEIMRKQPWSEGRKPGFAERMHEQAMAAYDLER